MKTFMIKRHLFTAAAVIAALHLAACAEDEAVSAEGGSAATAAPSAGEQEYAQLTAGWSEAALENCGRTLRETLGTRDLVQGALDGVKDPEGKATAEIEDARHWKQQGDDKVASIRSQLEAGACSEDVPLALDEAVQFYVKAGTSAVQAGQIAGS